MKALRQAQIQEKSTPQSQATTSGSSVGNSWGNEAEKSWLSQAATEEESESSPCSQPWQTDSMHEDSAWWQPTAKAAPEEMSEQDDAKKREPLEKPEYRNIGGERVRVKSVWEAEESERIMLKLEKVYHIEVGVFRDALQAKGASEEVLEEIAVRSRYSQSEQGGGPVAWEYKELAAIERACGHYSAILGKNRESSSRKDTQQEVDTLYKRNASGTALADYLQGPDRVRFFIANTGADFDFDTNAQQLEGTAIHELAHGLCRYKMNDYISQIGYWKGRKRNRRGEAPITSYGKKTPGEDMSEAVMFYFINPEKLKSMCPMRFAFIKEMVEGWTAKKD